MGNLDKEIIKSSHRTYSNKKFDERYKRMTMYIDQDLYEQIQYQREQGNITNVTVFVNNAILHYMNNG